MMADLLSISERAEYSGALVDLFDTLKIGAGGTIRYITVNKRPIQVFANANAAYLPGYGNAAQDANFTYQAVSQDFEANIFYKGDAIDQAIQEAKLAIFDGDVKIKVKQDARDYIKNGHTESIIVDGRTYNNISQERVQNFFGAVFYYFTLKETS